VRALAKLKKKLINNKPVEDSIREKAGLRGKRATTERGWLKSLIGPALRPHMQETANE